MALFDIGLSLVKGFLGKKKSGGETITAEQQQNPLTTKTGGQLSSFVDQFLPMFKPGEPFAGKLTAGSTDIEKTGLDQLRGFLAQSPIGELFRSGKEQISKTLRGDFLDPSKSPFIRDITSALQSVGKQNLEDAITASRRRAGSRGKFFSDSAIREERELGTRSLTNLNATIAGILNQFAGAERGRQFAAADKAFDFNKFENLTAPLSKIDASQSLGDLERVIEQGELDRRFQDFKRQRGELEKPLQVAQDLFSQSRSLPSDIVTPRVVENNTLGNIIEVIQQSGKGAKKDLAKILKFFNPATAGA